MKRTEYIVDKFIDYTGKERQFVMAAVSIHAERNVYIEEDGEEFTHEILNDDKILSIGVSVCRPNDEFDEAIGKNIAEGKAIKYRTHALYTTDAGLVNKIMVQALLQQEAAYFKSNPGRYLAGYDKDAAKYRESERIEKYIDALEGNAKVAFDYFTSLEKEADIQSFIDALNYVDR